MSIVFAFLLGIGHSLHAQEPDVNPLKQEGIAKSWIKWVGQYSAENENNKKKGFFKRVEKTLFGEKQSALIKPVSVLAENDKHFWIADQGKGVIIEIDLRKRKSFQTINKKNTSFASLVGICKANNHRIFFTDSRLNQIYFFTEGQKGIHVLNDSLTLQRPTGIAYSAITNELWVVETGAHRITVLDSKGRILRTIGERGTTPGTFNFPTHIWIDKSGVVYIVDSMNFRVQIFDSKGKLISFFGENGDATGYFAQPKGIATDSHGNIYVVDVLFHTIQVFNKSGELLHYFGGQGRGEGKFWLPTGIYIDDNDFVYIADSYNSRIQIFQRTNLD